MSIDTAMAAADERRRAGPFAFPTAYNGEHEGMTLRDWFAGRAMQSLTSNMADSLAEGYANLDTALTNAARLSYAISDAMLLARK